MNNKWKLIPAIGICSACMLGLGTGAAFAQEPSMAPSDQAATAQPERGNLAAMYRGSQVDFVNRTNYVIAVRQVENGKMDGGEAAPIIMKPGNHHTFAGNNYGENAADVRLRIYSTVRHNEGFREVYAPATLRQIVVASNWAMGTPYANVLSQDFKPTSTMRNHSLGRAIDENKDATLNGYGQELFAARKSDSSNYKEFMIELRKLSETPTQDYGAPKKGECDDFVR